MEMNAAVMSEKEHSSFAAEPAVYANKYFVGTFGNNTFKIVFAEEDINTKQVYMRFATLVPLEGLYALVNACTEAIKNQQAIAEKMKADYDAQMQQSKANGIDRNRATDVE